MSLQRNNVWSMDAASAYGEAAAVGLRAEPTVDAHLDCRP